MPTLRTALASFALLATFGGAPAVAADPNHVPHVEKQSWTFAGPFGTFDRGQLQRGYKVYKEVCAACHGLKYVRYRNLAEDGGPGFSEDQVKALAAEIKVRDVPNTEGGYDERPGRPSDALPSPYATEEQARATFGGSYPPDLSLIAKARAAHRGFPWFITDALAQYQEAGADYIYALLTGYKDEPPPGITCGPGLNYNEAFLGGPCIAMAKPLSDDQVTYDDGAPQTVAQYSKDIAAFLMWAAEPKLEERKEMGFKVMVFLLVFAAMLFLVKRKVWADAH